ncbi:hypothetical protein CK216_28380 [Mesorhizobium sp. WSM3876]|nr:hypothetical protein CK216_28380 [Mesorhizobium sp. WSM3876]
MDRQMQCEVFLGAEHFLGDPVVSGEEPCQREAEKLWRMKLSKLGQLWEGGGGVRRPSAHPAEPPPRSAVVSSSSRSMQHM